MTGGARQPALEFEQAYAERSGVTVEFLHYHGRHVEPCNCGEEDCEGWAMGHPWEDAIVEDRIRSHRWRGARQPAWWYVPPWRLTNPLIGVPGFRPPFHFGVDEFDRRTACFMLPLLGELVVPLATSEQANDA